MCLSTTHYKLPTAESPAGNCSLARIFLERQPAIALLRDVDERLPGDEVQRPGIFLIAHECNHDPRSIQSAHALQRLERVEHYDIAAFMSELPAPAASVSILTNRSPSPS